MSRILVTGADGFVGKVVCAKLLAVGHTPVAGLRDCDRWPSLREAAPGVKEFFALGNLGQTPIPAGAICDVDAIIHLAGRVHVMRDPSSDSLKQFRQTNVDGTRAIALAAVEQGIRRIVFVSTAKVNGESTERLPFTEEDPVDPGDPYAISKWEAEEALRSIEAKTGLEVVVIRPPLVYGPGVRANFLQLMKLVDRGMPLPIPDAKNKRSLIGVENLADFAVECVAHHGAANQTFMVSDGEDLSTRELVAQLARALGCSARFLPISASMMRFAGRLLRKESSVDRLLGSFAICSDKARQTLDWSPPVTLGDGLAATTRWYLNTFRQPAKSGKVCLD